jgi:hypothetical protein
MKSTISKAHVSIFDAVAGAVRNTAHGHKHWRLTDTMARSIAKRAAGTLTAVWPDVLAARYVPSDGADGSGPSSRWPPPFRPNRKAGGGRRVYARRSPLFSLIRQIAAQIGPAKRAGRHERAQALIDVLRLIAKTQP